MQEQEEFNFTIEPRCDVTMHVQSRELYPVMVNYIRISAAGRFNLYLGDHGLSESESRGPRLRIG